MALTICDWKVGIARGGRLQHAFTETAVIPGMVIRSATRDFIAYLIWKVKKVRYMQGIFMVLVTKINTKFISKEFQNINCENLMSLYYSFFMVIR